MEFPFSVTSVFFPTFFSSFRHLFAVLEPASANSLPVLQPIPSQIPGMEARGSCDFPVQAESCLYSVFDPAKHGAKKAHCLESTRKTVQHIQGIAETGIGIIFFPISGSLCNINNLCSFVLYLL